MELDDIIETIVTNLQKNGFPDKKVSFMKQKLLPFIEKHDFSMSEVQGELEDNDIYVIEEMERFIFQSEPVEESPDVNQMREAIEKLKAQGGDLQQKSQEMWNNMGEAEKKELMERFAKLDPKERQKIMEMGRSLGF